MKLIDTALKIDSHLRAWQLDPQKNVDKRGERWLFSAGAFPIGQRVLVVYFNPLTNYLTKAQAEKYLAWIEAGNVGPHTEALREGEG